MTNSRDTPNGDEVSPRDFASMLLDELRKTGDPDVGLAIAYSLLGHGPDFDVDLLLELIECILELSNAAGSNDSKRFLEDDWPQLKLLRSKRLTRKKENQVRSLRDPPDSKEDE
ncbi:MAG: hypothetical protein AAGH76_06385 [Pseudomonadota bacterium]